MEKRIERTMNPLYLHHALHTYTLHFYEWWGCKVEVQEVSSPPPHTNISRCLVVVLCPVQVHGKFGVHTVFWSLMRLSGEPNTQRKVCSWAQADMPTAAV